MDQTKGEIGDLRRLILVCQSFKSCKYQNPDLNSSSAALKPTANLCPLQGQTYDGDFICTVSLFSLVNCLAPH